MRITTGLILRSKRVHRTFQRLNIGFVAQRGQMAETTQTRFNSVSYAGVLMGSSNVTTAKCRVTNHRNKHEPLRPRISSKPRKGAIMNEHKNIDTAIFEFQQRFGGVEKIRKNPFTNSMYASLDDVANKANPILHDLGISTTYPITTVPHPDGSCFVSLLTCRLMHVESGEYRESTILLPDPSDNAQTIGSHLTYYRRYLKCCMLHIVETSDDDGNATVDVSVRVLTEKQHSEILDYVEVTGTNVGDKDSEGTLLHHISVTMNLDAIEHLSTSQASTILKMLKTKYKRQQAKK